MYDVAGLGRGDTMADRKGFIHLAQVPMSLGAGQRGTLHLHPPTGTIVGHETSELRKAAKVARPTAQAPRE